jgi:hypothetical protein
VRGDTCGHPRLQALVCAGVRVSSQLSLMSVISFEVLEVLKIPNQTRVSKSPKTEKKFKKSWTFQKSQVLLDFLTGKKAPYIYIWGGGGPGQVTASQCQVCWPQDPQRVLLLLV